MSSRFEYTPKASTLSEQLETYDNPDHTSVARAAVRASSQDRSKYKWQVPIDKVSPKERDRRVLASTMWRILEQAGQYEPSDPETTRRLVHEYQTKGDLVAKERVVNENMRLVIHFAKDGWRMLKAMNGTTTMEFADLVQEGMIGLQRAVEKYDPEHKSEAKFSTYAIYYIRSAIDRAIKDKASTIRIPVHVAESTHKTEKVLRNLEMGLQRKVVGSDLASDSIQPPQEIQEAVFDEEGFLLGDISERALALLQKTYAQEVASDIDETFGEWLRTKLLRTPKSIERIYEASDGDSEVLIDHALDEIDFDIQQRIDREQLFRAIKDTLSYRERKVLVLRYGILDNDEWTLDRIGRLFGITRERVRQIENQSLKKLQVLAETQRLKLSDQEFASYADTKLTDALRTIAMQDTIYPRPTLEVGDDTPPWPYKISYRSLTPSKSSRTKRTVKYLQTQDSALSSFEESGTVADLDNHLVQQLLTALEKTLTQLKDSFGENKFTTEKIIQLHKEIDVLYGIIEGEDFSKKEEHVDLRICRARIAVQMSQLGSTSS